jgi:hypothetical protein
MLARIVAPAAMLALCACSMPIGSLLGDDETGSIRPNPLAKELDTADWIIAQPILNAALRDEQGEPAAWINPDSGHGGVFEPVGAGFPRNGRTCRAFVARVTAGGPARLVQAVGCLGEGDKVEIAQVAAWKGL